MNREGLFCLLPSIPDPVIRSFTQYVLESAPPHFWVKPSSAGRHHPADEHSSGGLVLHTVRVVRVGLVICKSSSPRLNPNTIMSACFLHDICRYGGGVQPSSYSLDDHPNIAARLVRQLGNGSGFVTDISDAVETHSGRWGKPLPRTEEDWVVHYADCIAANFEEWTSYGKV